MKNTIYVFKEIALKIIFVVVSFLLNEKIMRPASFSLDVSADTAELKPTIKLFTSVCDASWRSVKTTRFDLFRHIHVLVSEDLKVRNSTNVKSHPAFVGFPLVWT